MSAKKNPKIDIARNSGIYFAIGLNLMLLLTWQLLEYKTYEKDVVAIDVLNMNAEFETDIPVININTPPPPPPPVAIQESIKIVDDIQEIKETVIVSTETNQTDAIAERVVNVVDVKVKVVEEDVEVAFAVIEDVPIYPGCEGLSKNEIKDCFQRKIQEHVVKNFRYPEAALELGIQGRVSVMFVIDSKGYASGVRSRGPDKILEKEAERIIGLLPKMQPGKQRGKAVKVSYAIPIFFRFEAR
jgi:protein TonB